MKEGEEAGGQYESCMWYLLGKTRLKRSKSKAEQNRQMCAVES